MRPSTGSNCSAGTLGSVSWGASLFAAHVLARNLIAEEREQEVQEIREFISTIMPDVH